MAATKRVHTPALTEEHVLRSFAAGKATGKKLRERLRKQLGRRVYAYELDPIISRLITDRRVGWVSTRGAWALQVDRSTTTGGPQEKCGDDEQDAAHE
jgi:hypothetical protein